MSEELDVQAIVTSSRSDVGRTRSENQDSCGDFLHLAGARLLILADGMGGHRGGRRASRTCVDAFARIFKRQAGGPEDQLREAFDLANDEIYTTALEDEDLRGMGTTGVALIFARDGSALIGWVGDSRAYRLRDADLEQMTEDHSLVAEWVRMGVLSSEEAETHPRRSELTRAIGVQPDVEAEIKPLDVRPGDRFLLCSDGLSGLVPEAEIRSILGSQEPAAAVEALVARANAAGGTDNVSVQIALLPLPETDGAPMIAPPPDTDPAEQRPDEDRLAPLSLPELPPPPIPRQVVITESPGLHGASVIVGAAIAIVGLTIGYVALTRIGSEPPPAPPTSHHDIAPLDPLPPPTDPLDSMSVLPTLEIDVEEPLANGGTAPAASEPDVLAVTEEPAAEPTPPAPEALQPPAEPPAEPVVGPSPEPGPEPEERADPVVEPDSAAEVDEPEAEALVAQVDLAPEADPIDTTLPHAPPPSVPTPPAEIPTTAEFELEPDLHQFLDGWLRAAATRDFGLYHALGFPDAPDLFSRTYARWEGFRFERIEIDADRSKPSKLYLRAVLSYVFEDETGRWRTEDEHLLVLTTSPDGLRYEARWK